MNSDVYKLAKAIKEGLLRKQAPKVLEESENIESLSEEEYNSLIEDYESLDEISKKTLSNYIHNAKKNEEDHRAWGAEELKAAKNKNLPKSERRKAMDNAVEHDYVATKRFNGRLKAQKRMMESVEELIQVYDSLDEDSKKYVMDYLKISKE